MLRQLFKNKNGQNTAEYALLIALVVAGIVAMQTYAQRSLQARVRDASQYLTTTTNTIGNSVQYEPYYLQTNYEVTRDSGSNQRLSKGTTAADSFTNRERAKGGSQVSTYNTSVNGLTNGL
ncbi:MAG: hypothetical protein HY209_02955 [Candidatus Omnitrophica bacterium]|nr:hypothetical protein [Candidatus Omnitrophota bacterium]